MSTRGLKAESKLKIPKKLKNISDSLPMSPETEEVVGHQSFPINVSVSGVLVSDDAKLTEQKLSSDKRCQGQDENSEAQQANAVVQEAKDALESRLSGNLKKEVREFVVDKLYFLYGIILDLIEKQDKLKKKIEKVPLNTQNDTNKEPIEELTKQLNKINKKMDIMSEKLTNIKKNEDSHEIAKNLKEIKQLVTHRNVEHKTVDKLMEKNKAEISKTPRIETGSYSIIVKSKNDQDTSEDVLNKIRVAVEAKKERNASGRGEESGTAKSGADYIISIRPK